MLQLPFIIFFFLSFIGRVDFILFSTLDEKTKQFVEKKYEPIFY